MAKSNEQLEDILDDLSVIKNNNVATEQRLGNIENLLAKLATKEEVAPITPLASTSAAFIPYDEIKMQFTKKWIVILTPCLILQNFYRIRPSNAWGLSSLNCMLKKLINTWKRRKGKRVQTQRVSAKAKSARLNDH